MSFPDVDSEIPRSSVVRRAVAYAEGVLPPPEAREFEVRVRRDPWFRGVALGRLAIRPVPPLVLAERLVALRPRNDQDRERAIARFETQIELAFEAQFPTKEQVQLRERVWGESRYRHAFPTINVTTMRITRVHLRLVRE